MLVLTMFAFVSAVHAQPARDCPPEAVPPTVEQLTRAQAEARDRGFLWRISRDGRATYLYGTLHVGRDQWLAPGPPLRAALLASDTVALEMDPLDAAMHKEMAALMAAHVAARPHDALPRESARRWSAPGPPPAR